MSLSSIKQVIVKVRKTNSSSLNLSWIDLNDDDLRKLMPEIKNCKGLTRLYLNDNKLTNADILKDLTSLTSLDLSRNSLTDVDFLKYLKRLTFLGLDGNSLTDVNFLKNLTGLTNLFLSENKLTNVVILENLRELTSLVLNNNNLTNVDFLKKLKGLIKLGLNGNKLTDVSVLIELNNLKYLSLSGNELPFPDEIIADSYRPQKILDYLKEYYKEKSQGSLRRLNEARLVVVGEANVGKTCVINRLIDKQFIPTDSTHGIQIRKWKDILLENGEKVQMNVWDFGGQEIMHSTHQFFFSNRTVYLLVVNARENEDAGTTEEWLRRIQNLSKDSPVFIVGNKIDQNDRAADRTNLGYFDIERKRLFAKFPELLKGIYGITSDLNKKEYDFLFEEFVQALIKEIGGLKNIHNEFPERWFEVKDRLEKMREDHTPFIRYEEYIDYCIQAGMANNSNRKTWIEFLNDIGVALTYSDDKNLRNYLAVLNPEWITKGVYALIDNAQIALSKGVLKREEIGSYLDPGKYPQGTQDFILNMMKKFRLLIDIEEDETFLIPDLLPKDEPEIPLGEDILHFQYGYDIYEKSIIRQFIVETYGLRLSNNYWRNGIVLKRRNNQALVQADIQDKTISIKIDGTPNTRREFLAIIRGKFDEIHDRFDNLNVQTRIAHFKHPEILKDYEELLKMEAYGLSEVYVKELDQVCLLSEFLNGVEEFETRRNKKIFDSKTTINVEGDLNMGGDKFDISGQAGAVGRNPHAHDMTFNQVRSQKKRSLTGFPGEVEEPNITENDFPELSREELEIMLKGKAVEAKSETFTGIIEALAGIALIVLAYFKSDYVIKEWGELEPRTFVYLSVYLPGAILFLFGIFRKQISIEIIDRWLINLITFIFSKIKNLPLGEYREICRKYEKTKS